jgi:hypothetical protein
VDESKALVDEMLERSGAEFPSEEVREVFLREVADLMAVLNFPRVMETNRPP